MKTIKMLIPWIGCVIAAAVLVQIYGANQNVTAQLEELRSQDSELHRMREAAENVKQLRREMDQAGSENLSGSTEDLMTLRNDVRRLREQHRQLQIALEQSKNSQKELRELEALQKQNEQLRTQVQQLEEDRTEEKADYQAKVCQNNLKEIEKAKYAWAGAERKSEGASVLRRQILPFLENQTMPQCPAGGVYTLNRVGTPATCNYGGHAL